MQVILCQNSFIPQKDNFDIGIQVLVLCYVWRMDSDRRFSYILVNARCWNCLIQGIVGSTCKKYRF